MPADGISPPQSVSAGLTGRPRRRKAPRGLAPRSLRKFWLPFRSRRKHRRPAKRCRRQRLSLRKSKQKQRRLGLSLNRQRPWDAVPPPRVQVPGTGADGAATTRTALPAGLTTPPANANHGRLGLQEGSHPRRLPKRKLLLPLNALRARRSKIPRKYPRRAFVGVRAIPDWLRGYRSSK